MYDLDQSDLEEEHATLLAHALAGRIVVDVERVSLEHVADAWRRKIAGEPVKLVLVPWRRHVPAE